MKNAIVIETIVKADLAASVKTLKSFSAIDACVVFIRRDGTADSLGKDVASLGKLPCPHVAFVPLGGDVDKYIASKGFKIVAKLLPKKTVALVDKYQYRYAALCKKCERVIREVKSEKTKTDIEQIIDQFKNGSVEYELIEGDKSYTILEYEGGCC